MNFIKNTLAFILLLYTLCLQAQMKVGNQVFYGNEWIDYNTLYYKINVAEDGWYKLPAALLKSAGITNAPGFNEAKLHLYCNGKQIAMVTESLGSDSGYLLFFGEKNRMSLDSFLYDNWKENLLNPNYSLFTDTSAYYLAYIPQAADGLRYNILQPDYNNNNAEPSPYYWHTEEISFNTSHFKPVINSQNYRYSHFLKSEGYVKNFSSSTLDTIRVSKIYTGNNNLVARFSMLISTNNNITNQKNIFLNDQLLGIDNTASNKIARPVFDISLNSLSAQNILKIQSQQNIENHGLSYRKLVYPRIPDLESIDFTYLTTTEKYLKINSWRSELPFVLEKNSNALYQIRQIGSTAEILIEKEGEKKIAADQLVTVVNKLESIQFRDFKKVNPDYLIISSKKFYQSKGSDIDHLVEYKSYRSSPQGGEHIVELLWDEEIYNQFGYGLVNHPWAFKNFSHYIQNIWPRLDNVFLIGKGREYPYIRTNEQLRNTANTTYYLATFGISPSDVLLFSSGKSMKTKFSIGRLSAKNMEEIGYYLDKIKVHDAVVSSGNQPWTKNIMHLGGGTDAPERTEIRSFLLQMENLVRAPMFGANVKTFYKDNAAEVQIANLEGINNFIKEGTSIINFFGHAAVGSFDFSLDVPANYDNKGRLPFIFSLGCYSGNICSFGTGISEQFILAPEKGAVGFVAASGSAALHSQGEYGLKFYKELSGNMYGSSIGQILRKISTDVDISINGNYESILNYYDVTLYQQLVLHGDPSIRFASFAKPDYTFISEQTKTEPSLITIEKDSFEFHTVIQNNGKAITDSISISFAHHGPDGKIVSEIQQKIAAPYYAASITLKFPIIGHNLIGENKITGTVDAGYEIDELNESNNYILGSNNQKEFVFFILSNDLRALHPSEFAIVNDKEPLKLIASAVNPFSEAGDYRFQLDTTELFNSNLLSEYTATNTNGYVEWQPAVNLIEGTTYYWRVARVADNITNWSNSSFTYLAKSPEGWMQQHYYQFLKNENKGIIPLPGQSFKYDKLAYLIKVQSFKYIDDNNVPFTIVAGEKYGSLSPGRGNIDALNVLIWYNKGIYKNKTKTDYGTSSFSNNIFSFNITTEQGRKGLKQLLEAAPDSAYIFIWTYIKSENSTFNISKWEADKDNVGYTLFETMETYGAKEFEQMRTKGPLPYIYFFRKAMGEKFETIGLNIFDQINYSTTVLSSNFKGSFSNKVGPAINWSSAEISTENTIPKDSASWVNIYTIDKNNLRSLYTSKLVGEKQLNDIDASVHPFLEVEYETFDLVNYDPTPLYFWKVLYEGSPDIYMNEDESFIYKDTFEQGEPFIFPIYIGQEGVNKIDSVNVRLQLINGGNGKIETYKKVYQILKNNEQRIEFNLDTKQLTGLYQLQVTVNYDTLIYEKAFFNNTGVKNIYFKPDMLNPVMDVTFDGIRILDGDVVSANTTIRIAVKDENRFLLMDNKEIFELSIKAEDTGITTQIPSNDPAVTFEPATDTKNNTASILYQAALQDGYYTLRANAKDVTGNNSGNLEYTVRFRVVSKKQISNLVNYPNPFSNSTAFVFDLSGGVPENLRITIMTVTGKVVREITGDELGPLHMGRNMTRFKWNGTDEFGNKLANGIYLYTIKTSDKEFEINSPFAKDNYGKMVIIR